MEDFLRVNQIADEYGVARSTVISWIESGELPAINLKKSGSGRNSYRVARISLDIFLEKRGSLRV